MNDPVFRLPKARISYGVLAHALKTLKSGKPYTNQEMLEEALRFCGLPQDKIDTVLNALYHGTNREEAQKILIKAMDELRKFVEHHLQMAEVSEKEVRELKNLIKRG